MQPRTIIHLAALLASCLLLAFTPAKAGDYVPDTSYNDGKMTSDVFGSAFSYDYIGRKAVRLENGDVVIAGVIPPSSGNPDHLALGLVRRNLAGQRVPWSAPGANGIVNDEYLVFHGGTSGVTVTYMESVRDIIAHGDLLFVLVDTRTTTGIFQSSIYVLGTDGSFKFSMQADDQYSASGRTVWGSGLAAYSLVGSGTTLIYAGRKLVGDKERIRFRRLSVASDGSMPPSANAVDLNPGSCAGNHCSVFGLALGGKTNLAAAPRLYITGSYYQPACTGGGICPMEGWYAFMTRISPTDGAAIGNFHTLPGRGRAIATKARGSYITSTADDVFIAAERDRSCRNGMVIAGFTESTPELSFYWEQVLGGSSALPCLPTVRSATPTAIAVSGDRLAVAGYGTRKVITPCLPGQTCPQQEDNVDGAIAVLDAETGTVLSSSNGSATPLYYSYADAPGGARTRHSGFHDIVASANDTFTVAGDSRLPESHAVPSYRGKRQFISLRVRDADGQGGSTLFGDGFEGAAGGTPPASAVANLMIEKNLTVAAMTSDRFTWRDSANRPRSAVLAHNDGQTGPQGSGSPYANRGGALRQYSYQLANGDNRTLNVTTSGNAGQGGFGYVVSHAGTLDNCTTADDSPLGFAFPGQFTRVFEGRHHAVFRFTQNYPRHCTAAAPAQDYTLPVTIEWTFSTGRDHPLWSVTYDLSAIPANRLADDSRAPYGELLIDGAPSEASHAQIAGVAWGDRYRFTSTNAPVTTASQWTWNQPNTIPHVKIWTTVPDATMGIVQTQTIVQQDAGGYWGTGSWNQSSNGSNGCTQPATTMPCAWNWPFQSIGYSLGASPTRNTRMAWGTNAGFLGQSSYYTHGSAWYGGPLPNTTASGHPRKSYSTYIVFGQHSIGPVEAQVAQIERIQAITLSASLGSVAASGPRGVADNNTQTYQPAGYDPVRGALTFIASANQLDANIAATGGALVNPLLIVRAYTGSQTPQVRLGNQLLVADVDYFASRRADTNELWITLNRSLSGTSQRLQITP